MEIKINNKNQRCSKIIDFWHTRKAKLFLVFLSLFLFKIYLKDIIKR